LQGHTIQTSHCFEVFELVYPVGISSLGAHSRTRNGNIVIKDAHLKIQSCK
jgi:hypothetical protein